LSDVLVQARSIGRKGPVVTFSGVEGTGKTSMALVAADELRRQGYRVRILRLYPLSLKFIIKWTMMALFPDIKREVNAETRIEKPKSALYLFIRKQLFRLDCLYHGQVLKFFSERGIAVVCDRYLYDSLARILDEGSCDESECTRLAKHIPQPDAAFLLKAKTDIIEKRRRNYEGDELPDVSNAYIRLSDMGDFWIIDTDDGRKARSEIRGILSYAGRRW